MMKLFKAGEHQREHYMKLEGEKVEARRAAKQKRDERKRVMEEKEAAEAKIPAGFPGYYDEAYNNAKKMFCQSPKKKIFLS